MKINKKNKPASLFSFLLNFLKISSLFFKTSYSISHLFHNPNSTIKTIFQQRT